MDEATSAQAKAASISLEDFFDVASRSVFRAVQAQRPLDPRFPWPYGPIIWGFIFNPPDMTRTPFEVRDIQDQ